MNVLPQEYKPEYPINRLKLHPQNPNHGNVEVIGESIETNGFYGAVLCQKSTRFVLRGNHTLKAAVEKGAKTIPTFIVDCDDETALKILLVDNQSARLAEMDNEVLVGHLHALVEAAEGNMTALMGTGFNEERMRELENMLEAARLAATGPEQFNEVDENIETEVECPKCGYRFSGGKRTPKTTVDGDGDES